MSVAIGAFAGNSSQAESSVAIGTNAGQSSQGTQSVAIGPNAGQTNQHNNTIILNALGSALNSGIGGAFYVAPIRGDNSSASTVKSLYYDTITHEIFYKP